VLTQFEAVNDRALCATAWKCWYLQWKSRPKDPSTWAQFTEIPNDYDRQRSARRLERRLHSGEMRVNSNAWPWGTRLNLVDDRA
jgi:hypothetical protein